MRARVLDAVAQRQLVETRAGLADLHGILVRAPATDDDLRTLGAAVAQLDEMFLLVVVGEFNAGKSAFINALVGDKLLDEGVTPTTSQIHLLKYGEQVSRTLSPSGVYVVTAPVDLLRDTHIVDTPGTNAIIREHEQLTTHFVPRSDIVLFITSADRPFTETERAFLEVIRDWGKKVLLIVNKIDILEQPEQRDEVLRFVRDAASRQLGVTPEIFPVSARLAWRAKHGEPAQWDASGFGALERYLEETLDDGQRFKFKLANPLGVGDALAKRYRAVADERAALLADDVTALADIERQLSLYREDLARGFELRMTGIEKVLLEMEARGHTYFDDTLRIARVFDLLNRPRIQLEFEERVVADAPQQVERRVAELVNWLVDEDFAQWQAVTTRLVARSREHGDRVSFGAEIGSFTADRARLLDSVGREAQRVVESYDRRREAAAIADTARVSVAATAAAGVSALGLGALVTAAATTMAADITGLLMASVLAAVGFFVLPARRRQARADLREKMSALRQRLVTALRTEFEGAQERNAHRLADATAPYSRFVRSEQSRWDDLRTTLASLRERIGAMLIELSARG